MPWLALAQKLAFWFPVVLAVILWRSQRARALWLLGLTVLQFLALVVVRSVASGYAADAVVPPWDVVLFMQLFQVLPLIVLMVLVARATSVLASDMRGRRVIRIAGILYLAFGAFVLMILVQDLFGGA
nr:hypothetical protein [uncultured Celeribacter sp.]